MLHFKTNPYMNIYLSTYFFKKTMEFLGILPNVLHKQTIYFNASN